MKNIKHQTGHAKVCCGAISLLREPVWQKSIKWDMQQAFPNVCGYAETPNKFPGKFLRDAINRSFDFSYKIVNEEQTN